MTKSLRSVLICDDDPLFRLAATRCLRDQYECFSASNSDEAFLLLKKKSIDILLLDVNIRTPDEGLRFIPVARDLDPELAIVMVSGRSDLTLVREAMRLGANDYLPKDFEVEEILHTLEQVLDVRDLKQRNLQKDYEAVSTQRQNILIGNSHEIVALRRIIERVRLSTANVVITGETGTGKEVVARLLRGTLPDGTLAPFVAIDSSTIQSSMAESILFGHEKGAFTGAERQTKGLFEEAHNGIVYFDEISNMPLEIQSKLLRVIQEKEITRVGSSKVIQLNFRVVCATNQKLQELTASGKFKEDLLQRLNVIPIQLSSLRDRNEDVSLLVNHWIKKQPFPANQVIFTPEALQILRSYPWPGNIRELGNLIAFITTMSDNKEIEVADLPPHIRDTAERKVQKESQTELGSTLGQVTFYEKVRAFEKRLLESEYEHCNQNVSKMALNLGMNRSYLYMKLKEYFIKS